jgi:hypothetical protein
MKRPVQFKDHVQIKMASFLSLFTRTDEAAIEKRAMSTIDQSAIRGSSARLAFMVVIRRELSLTTRADSGRGPAA